VFGLHHSLKTARRYVECVNARDVDGLREILDADCKLIDARGDWIEGRDNCLSAFERFFAIEPAYRLEVETMGRSGEHVLITGRSRASDPRFATSRVFRARCDEHVLFEWQSYSDQQGTAICRLLAGDKAQHGPFVEQPF
jgi:ketosteroid isomerase-like protein